MCVCLSGSAGGCVCASPWLSCVTFFGYNFTHVEHAGLERAVASVLMPSNHFHWSAHLPRTLLITNFNFDWKERKKGKKNRTSRKHKFRPSICNSSTELNSCLLFDKRFFFLFRFLFSCWCRKAHPNLKLRDMTTWHIICLNFNEPKHNLDFDGYAQITYNVTKSSFHCAVEWRAI